jgi:Flp pilus assembly pilin Flp
MSVVSKFKGRRGVTAIEYGILAALIIMLAIAFIGLTGVNLKNVFNGVGSGLSPQKIISVAFAQNCAPAAALPNPYYIDQDNGTQLSFPTYSCGTDGINGPPTSNVYTTQGDSWGPTVLAYTNSSGTQSIYAEVASSGPNGPSQTGSFAYSGSFGWGFQDGYGYNAAWVTGSGMTFSQFQSICQGSSTLTLYSGVHNNVTYSGGTAYKTSDGSYVCGGATITSGSLQ